MLAAPVAGGSTIRCHTGCAWRAGRREGLDVETEDGGVAILENVLLPFDAKFPRSASLGPAAGVDKLFPADHFGLDEAPLEVPVDGPRRLRGARAATDRPGPALVLARGQKRDQAED